MRELARLPEKKELRGVGLRGVVCGSGIEIDSLYVTLSGLMREPERQVEVTMDLLSPPKATANVPDVAALDPRVIGLLAKVARNLDLMCRDYHRSYRAAAWILDRIEPRDRPSLLRIPLWVLKRVRQEKVETAAAVREKGKTLERLAGPTAAPA